MGLRIQVAPNPNFHPLSGRGLKVSSMVEPVSRRHSGKTIVVVVLDKAYERDVEGVRGRNDYYKSNLTKVRALVYEGGMQVASGILW
jgi:hypothetical protein